MRQKPVVFGTDDRVRLRRKAESARSQLAQPGRQSIVCRRPGIDIQLPDRAGGRPLLDERMIQGRRRNRHECQPLAEETRNIHALQVAQQGFVVETLHIGQAGIDVFVACPAQHEGIARHALITAQHGLAAHDRRRLARRLDDLRGLDAWRRWRSCIFPISRPHSDKTIQHAAYPRDRLGHIT